MSPLPKRRLSKGRRNRRRSHHSLSVAHLVPCPQCHALRRPHEVCPSCGSYKGVEVVEVKVKKKGE
ncbi:MAG: 50S ribosomal protein L32 [Anaerolineae bacterium]